MRDSLQRPYRSRQYHESQHDMPMTTKEGRRLTATLSRKRALTMCRGVDTTTQHKCGGGLVTLDDEASASRSMMS